MGPIDPEAASKLQPEPVSGESPLWAGAPEPDIIFASGGWYLIPFSVFWVARHYILGVGRAGPLGRERERCPLRLYEPLGNSVRMDRSTSSWGRSVYDGWLKRRTHYVVTARRILTVQEGWNRKATCNYIDAPAGDNLLRPQTPRTRRAKSIHPEREPLQSRGYTRIC